MTIINDIEIDNIDYKTNDITDAILNNDKIEDKLNVLMVISNPCLYAKRYILAKQFIFRMNRNADVNLYIVELAYKNQKYYITEANNNKHLQLRTDIPLWHKENMINLGIKYLLPNDWKAVAWVDADIEFENTNWASDTLKILNGCKDIVQLYSQADDTNKYNQSMKIFSSFGYQYNKKNNFDTKNRWHPGYCWAITRKAYEKIGNLYEYAILGSGDHIMTYCMINKGIHSINKNSSQGYKQSILEFQNKIKNLRLGYTPGLIRHYYHGCKKNRCYDTRWQILLKYNFDPIIHLEKDNIGIIIPSKECPKEIPDEIMRYFKNRNEDE